MIDGPNVSAGAYTWILVIIPICLILRNIVIIQVWFSLIESSRLLCAICGGTAKQECSLVLYGERRNRVGNSFRRRTVVKQTWTQFSNWRFIYTILCKYWTSYLHKCSCSLTSLGTAEINCSELFQLTIYRFHGYPEAALNSKTKTKFHDCWKHVCDESWCRLPLAWGLSGY